MDKGEKNLSLAQVINEAQNKCREKINEGGYTSTKTKGLTQSSLYPYI